MKPTVGKMLLTHHEEQVYKASWVLQFRALMWRSGISIMKDPKLVKVKLIQTVVSTFAIIKHKNNFARLLLLLC